MVVNVIFYINAVKIQMVYNNGDVQKVIPYAKEIMDEMIDLYTDWYENNRDTILQQNINYTMEIRNREYYI